MFGNVEQDSNIAALKYGFEGPQRMSGIHELKFSVEGAYVDQDLNTASGLVEESYDQYVAELTFRVPALSDVVCVQADVRQTQRSQHWGRKIWWSFCAMGV
ncbi:MAG: hypothetical protein U5O39_05550 [Gammaproteobacteria bacterium]|nr:hypothetical protein [Gammaproteobacteria bacterium]